MKALIYSGVTLFIAVVMVVLLLGLQTRATAAQNEEIHTLILTNQSALTQQFGITATQRLLSQLHDLAMHPTVSGTIILLDEIPTVAAAYAAWKTDLTNATYANQAAAAIHAVIRDAINSHHTLEYLVLVGDDRIIPHRRIADDTPLYPEKTYGLQPLTTTVAAALAANMFLSDDFYGDLQIAPSTTMTLSMPTTLAVGRLVETPLEMGAVITHFLQVDGQIQVKNSFVAGHDFIQDAAQATCDLFAGYLANSPNCALIGDTWASEQLDSQLQTSTAELLFLHTHMDHARLGGPTGTPIAATQVAQWPTPTGGRLVYSLGGHGGLNVPPENDRPLDWPQAWLAQGAVYLSNTGYDWGLTYDIGLSERLGLLFADALVHGAATDVGQALVVAKQRYWATAEQISAYDKKTVSQLTLFGLPMYHVTGFTGELADAFEPDDNCMQAQPILADSVPQVHTLHGADSADWLRLDTITGTTYTIEGRVTANMMLDVGISLHTNCGSPPPFVAAETTSNKSEAVKLSFIAPDRGPYLLQIRKQDLAAGSGAYTITVTPEVIATAEHQIFLPLIQNPTGGSGPLRDDAQFPSVMMGNPETS
ncbi:MAG: C25 family cysteine peptidase [Caldilineaceae bacterium]